MTIADTWGYQGGDSCADFFTGYLKAANPDVPDTAKVLEIGCSEFDWLTPASQAWPGMTFCGIDWRGKKPHPDPRVDRIKGDVMQPDTYAPESFDLIVSISAIEHIGLGHYEKDPPAADGDIIALANAFRWLKPGGWLLFDVPYDPTGYRVQGTECRVYDDDALFRRLWLEPLMRARTAAYWRATVYCKAKETTVLIEKPSEPCAPFYYVACAFEKVD